MIRAKMLEGNQVRFQFHGDEITFSSPLEARKWQFEQIFGEEPDFSFLPAEEESYLVDTFAINSSDSSQHLVEAVPCKVQHLQRILNQMELQVNVEEYLVAPLYK